jgi:hypothetical protein
MNRQPSAVRRILEDPASAAQGARRRMERNIRDWFQGLPELRHPDSRIVRFYRHAAVQLLWARWKLAKHWRSTRYSTSGRDSGALNAYAWDLQYAALALALLDPAGTRGLLVALPAAPLTRHFSIEPIRGDGLGSRLTSISGGRATGPSFRRLAAERLSSIG